MSKALCPQFQENPILRVEKWVMYNCTKHDCEQAEWFNASVLRTCWGMPPGGGALGYFLGGYVPPGTPNWHPVLKKNFPNIDTPF